MQPLSFWKKPLYSALVFFGTLIVLSVGYAAWNAAMSSVTAGNPLTANGWNALVDNINDLDSRWTRVSGGIAYTGGNVGIGTTTLTNKLNITGAVQSNAILTAVEPNTIAMSQEAGFGRVAAFGPNSSTAGTLDLYVIDSAGGNQKGIRINPSGNVGIGTPSPGARLDVAWDMIVSGNISNLLLKVNSACLSKATSGYYAYLISRDSSNTCDVACGETTGGSCLASYYNPGGTSSRSLPYICSTTVATYNLCCCSAGSWPSALGGHTVY